MWTLVAGVQPAFVIGMTATLRPAHEGCAAHAIGISNWDEVIRASCFRPSVSSSFHVHTNELSALQALIHFKPQLVCVKTKRDVESLCGNTALRSAYSEILPHFKELSDAEKVAHCQLSVLQFIVAHAHFSGKGILKTTRRHRNGACSCHVWSNNRCTC